MVAQHFTAFRQRYIMGWLAPTETEKVKASASRLLTFEDPDEMACHVLRCRRFQYFEVSVRKKDVRRCKRMPLLGQ